MSLKLGWFKKDRRIVGLPWFATFGSRWKKLMSHIAGGDKRPPIVEQVGVYNDLFACNEFSRESFSRFFSGWVLVGGGKVQDLGGKVGKWVKCWKCHKKTLPQIVIVVTSKFTTTRTAGGCCLSFLRMTPCILLLRALLPPCLVALVSPFASWFSWPSRRSSTVLPWEEKRTEKTANEKTGFCSCGLKQWSIFLFGVYVGPTDWSPPGKPDILRLAHPELGRHVRLASQSISFSFIGYAWEVFILLIVVSVVLVLVLMILMVLVVVIVLLLLVLVVKVIHTHTQTSRPDLKAAPMVEAEAPAMLSPRKLQDMIFPWIFSKKGLHLLMDVPGEHLHWNSPETWACFSNAEAIFWAVSKDIPCFVSREGRYDSTGIHHLEWNTHPDMYNHPSSTCLTVFLNVHHKHLADELVLNKWLVVEVGGFYHPYFSDGGELDGEKWIQADVRAVYDWEIWDFSKLLC